MVIVRADLIAAAAEIVMEVLFNVGLNLCLGAAGTGQEDGRGNSFRTLDALGVVVGHICGESRHPAHGFQIVVQPSDRRNPHSRTVTPAIVGLGMPIPEPPAEPSAITGMRIHTV